MNGLCLIIMLLCSIAIIVFAHIIAYFIVRRTVRDINPVYVDRFDDEDIMINTDDIRLMNSIVGEKEECSTCQCQR